MPVSQPNESPTQDWKERDAALSVTNQLNHDSFELYIPGSSLAGDGTFYGTNNPPSYEMGIGKEGHVVFLKPSYWWNGFLKFEVYWTRDASGSGTTSVDIEINTHRKGTAGDVTTLYSGTMAEAYDTEDEIQEYKFYTTTAMVEEDDLIHVSFESSTGAFCVIALEVEYLPIMEQ